MSVPREWTRLVGNVQLALQHRSAMRATKTTQQARDVAVIAYSRAVDTILDDLGTLSDAMVLGRITMFLARKERP